MKVLYIDDDIEDAEIFCEAIDEIDASIECTTCTKYAEVEEYLDTGCPDFVFLDYRMPLMDGRQLLMSIRGHQCFDKMQIIMYSTVMTDLDRAECKKLGAFDCLQKTGDFATLCKHISAILKRQ